MAKARTLTAKAKAPASTSTEATQAQSQMTMRGGVYAAVSRLIEGLSKVPPPTYETYRIMRTNPTIAMAMAVALAPVKFSTWGYEAEDGVPDDRVAFIKRAMERIRFRLKRDMTKAVWLGHQPFEKVWDVVDGRWQITEAKPLLPDITTIKVDEATGKFAGLENTGAMLEPDRSFNFVYDDDADGQFGRSRMENIRVWAWAPWMDSVKSQASYVRKGAGVLPQIHYPLGKTPDANGVEVDNSVHAQNVLAQLGSGNGVAIPQDFASWADDLNALLKSGVDPKSLMAWQISFLEARAGVGAEILTNMQHFEKLMARGWLVPERTFQEGTSGTKAEAGVHGDVALYSATELDLDIAACVNREFVDWMLRENWGEEAVGTVRVVPQPISDTDKEFVRDVVGTILKDPANIDIALATLDFDANLDRTGLSKSQDIVDVAAIRQPTDVPADQIAADVMSTPDGQQAVQEAALNGAQLTSMVDLVKQLTMKQLPPDAVRPMMTLAFPTANQALIDKIVAAASKFKPVLPELPPPADPRQQATVTMSRIWTRARQARGVA